MSLLRMRAGVGALSARALVFDDFGGRGGGGVRHRVVHGRHDWSTRRLLGRREGGLRSMSAPYDSWLLCDETSGRDARVRETAG